MAVFHQLTPSPLSADQDELAGRNNPNYISSKLANKYGHVRRPVRGTQPKPDTYATLEVKTNDGRNLLLLDSGGLVEKGGLAFSPKYSNFLMQSVQENKVEKSQIVETFGPAYIFFFGMRPTVYAISGVLLNSADFNWKAEFWENYDKYLRGTQCVTNGTKVYLSYDETLLKGYILGANVDVNSERPELTQFSFQFIVADDIQLSAVGDPTFPAITPVNLTDEEFAGLIENIAATAATGKISDNEDEYIARGSGTILKQDEIPGSNDIQLVDESSVDEELDKLLKDIGIEDNPSRELVASAKKKEFTTKREKRKKKTTDRNMLRTDNIKGVSASEFSGLDTDVEQNLETIWLTDRADSADLRVARQ